MPKGTREVFKVRLLLDRQQRAIWSQLEVQAASVDGIVRERMGQQATAGIDLHRDFFMKSIVERCEKAAPDLDRPAVENLVDQYRTAFLFRQRSGADMNRKRKTIPEVLVRKEDVAFSVTGHIVRIPHLGAVRYRPNKFIVVPPDAGEVSAEKVWLNQNIHRMFLFRQTADHLLIIDCSDQEEVERRRTFKKEKKLRRSEAAKKWLSD